MKEQLKAEAWVRSQRPALLELTFGCEVIVAGIREDNPGCENDVVVDSRKDEHGRIGLGYFGHVHPDDFKIIGHPIQLQDWLAELGRENHPHKRIVSFNHDTCSVDGVKFNLTTGQPADEQSYKAFNDIVGI